MIRRLALTGFVLLLIPPESETLRLFFAQIVTLIAICAIKLLAPYKRKDNNTLAILSQPSSSLSSSTHARTSQA